MLIVQIIEFELKGPGFRSRTCSLQMVVSMTKQKSLGKSSGG